MKNIVVLGSTGSIGKNTLDIVRHHPNQFKAFALTAKSQIENLFKQCQEFQPKYAVVYDEKLAKELSSKLIGVKLTTQVLFGPKALEDVVQMAEVDYVMAAIVGAAGLMPTLAAVRSGKRVLLANKESLVMSGALFMEAAQKSNADLLPVDSEHNAIFQCLPTGYRTGTRPDDVEKITLTASGGPFRNLPLEKFGEITKEQAIAHPKWSMGPKISVDSATLMNKGLEIIEAFWLYNMPVSDLEVIIHPQSTIHSMVSFEDGSSLAQLGNPDMRTPIAYTLSWPARIKTQVKKLNLMEIGQFTFEPVDAKRFPCLDLAYTVLKAGKSASAILNAANEISVEAFLQGKIKFTDIYRVNATVLERSNIVDVNTIDEVLEEDTRARNLALEAIKALI